MPIRIPARSLASFTSRQSDLPPCGWWKCAWMSISGSPPASGTASRISAGVLLVAQLDECGARGALHGGDRTRVVRDAGVVVCPALDHHPLGTSEREEPRLARRIIEPDEPHRVDPVHGHARNAARVDCGLDAPAQFGARGPERLADLGALMPVE